MSPPQPAQNPAHPTASADAVFAALADPTRRAVLSRLASAPATATELAAGLPITRQAIAKHLAVLADAGLVEAHRHGRETRYHVTPEPLSAAMGWMVEVGAAWDRRLARLHALLDGGTAGEG